MSGQGQRHIFRVTSALAFCLSLTAAQAAPADGIPAGDWRGILSSSASAGPVYVRLSGRAAGADGIQTADLRFGPPFNCALELRAQPDGYALSSRNGGRFCDALAGGRAQLQVSDGASSGMQLTLPGRDSPLIVVLDQSSAGLAEAGRWRGAGLISVQLEIVATTIRPGDVLGRLRYGAPRDCQVELRYAGRSADALNAWIVANDRGYCRQLSDGQASLRIRADGSAELALVVRGQRDTTLFERMP
ncbi:hypothetical protein [Xanthomonas melonis]|uniref:hypothetical protein n=1 Tax=Xanthomonas melonis TaxID=56456 RepID=UPI001E47DC3B|nr:hypothetical protein [Xanthomonas melonis]MCD0245308.1 hypothetical protein [Xanthomonas melonis]